jgi:hypothetical protein
MQEKADRRHFPRYPFVAYSEVTDLKHPDVHMRARTSDLAREGCYVDTITPFDVGTYVAVKIVKNEQRLLVNGRVFYSSAGMGMGIRFTPLKPGERHLIERWIIELRGEAEGD